MLKDALERIRAVAECLDSDDPDKIEMLNIEGDYTQIMEWALKKRTEYMAMANANKEIADVYKIREARFLNKSDSMKDIIGHIMLNANETSYKGVSGTVTKRMNAPKPIVTDEDKVPDEYKKKVIDKTAINKAVNDGVQIDGVSMDNGSESILIRVK